MQSSSDNVYRAPQSQLQSYGRQSDMSPKVAETLGKGAFWARVLSVGTFIFLIFLSIGVVGVLFGGMRFADLNLPKQGGALLMGFYLLVFIPIVVVTWFIAHAMHRYAKAAKGLRNDVDEALAAECFFFSTRVFKIFSICALLFYGLAIIGILTAVLANKGF